MEIDKKAVGMRISQIRRAKGMTLEEFGKIVGNAGKSIVSKWERGSHIPNNERLKKISEIGNTTVDHILYGSLDSYILNNFEELLPPNERYFAKVITLRQANDFINKLADRDFKFSDIEAIKTMVFNKLPEWKEEYRRKTEKEIKYINDWLEKDNNIKGHYLNTDNFDSKIVDKILKDSKNFSLKEMCLYNDEISDIYLTLKLVESNDSFFVGTEVPVFDENVFLNEINNLNFAMKNRNDYVRYQLNRKRSMPTDQKNHLILVEIVKENHCDLLKKKTSLLLDYFPKTKGNVFKKYITETQVTIIIENEFYLGYVDSNLIFRSLKNDETFYLDLNDDKKKVKIFPTLAVFY